MFSINILCFMSHSNFKGDTLYRLIPSGGIDLFISPDRRMGGYNITGHRNSLPGPTVIAHIQEPKRISDIKQLKIVLLCILPFAVGRFLC